MKQINLRTSCAVALGLGMMLVAAPHAFAQAAPPDAAPAAPDAGAPAAGGAQAPTDLGTIDTSKQTTVTTTTTQSGDDVNQSAGDNTAPLPNTGGEPLVFVLAGGVLIAGGWALRRKWTLANEQ